MLIAGKDGGWREWNEKQPVSSRKMKAMKSDNCHPINARTTNRQDNSQRKQR